MREIEAKFLAPGDLGRLIPVLSELGYRARALDPQEIVDRYRDTADWDISQAGWAYRRRKVNGEQIVALKQLGSERAVVWIRVEFEQRVPDRKGDDRLLPAGPVTDRLGRVVGRKPTRELFEVRNRRLRYGLTRCDGSAVCIELAVDHVEIRGRRRTRRAPGRLRFREIEFELRDGPESALIALAERLPRKIELLPARCSKFERGLQTIGVPDPPDATHPAPLAPTDRWVDLAFAHFRRQARVLRREERRAWEGLDPEGVHQMRVAMRRIRAALKAFEPVLPPRRVRGLNTELRWAGRALGAVRDLDVYHEALNRHLKTVSAGEARRLAPYRIYLNTVAQRRRRRLIATLGSRRFHRLRERLERFAERGPSQAATRRFRGLLISAAAGPAVERWLKRVLRGGRAIDGSATAEQMHALRIQSKQLRYLLEFVRMRGAAAGDPARRPIEEIKRLLDLMGIHQDAVVAARLARGFAETVAAGPATRPLLAALERLAQVHEQQRRKQEELFSEVWNQFDEAVSSARLPERLRAAG